jgi:hypothetical protein
MPGEDEVDAMRRSATSLADSLTRIEVKVSETAVVVGNVRDLLGTVQVEVIAHREKFGPIESAIQQLQSDAKVAAKGVVDAEATRLATAKLLKEATEKTLQEAKDADEKKVLAAKTLVEQTTAKSTTAWTHRQTVAAIVGVCCAVVFGIFGIIWAIKTGTPAPKLP